MLNEIMKPKIHLLLEQCVENGTRRGYYRAHKHNNNPDPETIFQEIEDSIMGEIYEWFDFPSNDLTDNSSQ